MSVLSIAMFSDLSCGKYAINSGWMNKLKNYKLGLEGCQWTALAEDLCAWLPGPTSGSSQLSANPAPGALTPLSSLSRHTHTQFKNRNRS